MTILDNLRQAAQELLGFNAPQRELSSDFSNGGKTETRESSELLSDDKVFTDFADASLAEEDSYTDYYPHKDTSLIARGTTVHGKIITNGHIEVLGKVNGNIEAGGDIAIQGNVSGNVSGKHIGLYTCVIKGNLKAVSGVVIDSESTVLGNVNTQNVVINGRVKGNIDVDQLIVFQGSAYILGDIKAQALSIETGAIINGMVTTTVDHDVESPFSDFY
jgi:cytoskeletal protein CcmA (bactofilin family)